jgi:nickel-dependent lactate racemase
VLRRAQLKYLVRIFRRDISGHVCGSIDVSDLHYKSKKWTRSTGSSKGYSNKWILKKKQKTIKKNQTNKKKQKETPVQKEYELNISIELFLTLTRSFFLNKCLYK